MSIISVIVPIFNAEKYLQQCLNSIREQTFKDIEIICVDNGSEDRSVEIIKNNIIVDDRIKLIEIEKSNAGIARNVGINNSNGEYIYFIDSDDWIELNTLENAYKFSKTNNLDICVFKYKRVNDKLNTIYKDTYGFSRSTRFINPMNEKYLFQITNFAVWNKLYKADLIKNSNLEFSSLKSSNDVKFSCLALALSNSVGLLDFSGYFYRSSRQGSITKNKSTTLFDFYESLLELKTELLQKDLFWKFQDSFINAAGEIIYFTNRIIDSAASKKLNDRLKEICFNLIIDKNKITNNQIKNFISKYTPKFSIIIPIYNCRKYISNCLNSILSQNYNNYEVICIDDGSTDNVLPLLEEYKNKYNNIRILTEVNSKAGTARNLGIKNSCGEYIWFVDADDSITENALSILDLNINTYSPQIVCFEACNVFEGGKHSQSIGQRIKNLIDSSGVSTPENIGSIKKSIPISACLFCVQREFLDLNNIRFSDYCFYEDNLFLIKSLHLSNKISYEKKILYYRYKRPGSITSDWSKNFDDYLLAIRQIQDFYESIKLDSNQKINSYCSTALSVYSKFSEEAKSKYRLSLICTLIYLNKYEKFGINLFGKDPFKENITNWWNSKRPNNRLDLDNPKTLGQVIQWIKVNDFKKFKTHLADKLAVREFVSRQIGSKYLVSLLGSYGSFDEIDFSKFNGKPVVLKCNHGSGWNHIIKDTSKFDKARLKRDFDRWMSTDYAKFAYELHYSCIPRRIIAEEYIDPRYSQFEIQVYLFNGKPEFVSVETVKTSDVNKRCIFNTNGDELNFMLTPEHYSKLENSNIDKSIIRECVQLSNKLLVNTPAVRIDFILHNNQIKFREITFTSGSGLSKFEPEEYDYKFGSMINLSNTNKVNNILVENINTVSSEISQVSYGVSQKTERDPPVTFTEYELTLLPNIKIFIPEDFWEFKADEDLMTLCQGNKTVYSWAYTFLHKKNLDYSVVKTNRKLSIEDENLIILILHEYPEILKHMKF